MLAVTIHEQHGVEAGMVEDSEKDEALATIIQQAKRIGEVVKRLRQIDQPRSAAISGTVMAGPRYAKVYQIHKTRCIFCGYCEEACPVSAIFMGKDYELAVYSKDDFVWDKTELLVPAPAGVTAPQSVR